MQAFAKWDKVAFKNGFLQGGSEATEIRSGLYISSPTSSPLRESYAHPRGTGRRARRASLI